MDRLTKEEIEAIVAAQRPRIGDIALIAADATSEEVLALCEQSLSQEAARDEVLEEAARACEADLRYFSEGFANGCRECAKAIRALKREPNAAAQEPEVGLNREPTLSCPAPAAPVAEMVRRLNELPWPKLNYPDEAEMRDLGYAALPLLQELPALLAKLGQTKQGFFAIGCSNEGQTLWLSKFNGGVNGSWTENPQEAFVFIHKKQADDVMTIPGIAAYQPFCQWIPPASGASDD